MQVEIVHCLNQNHLFLEKTSDANAANERKQVWLFSTSPSSCGTHRCSGPTLGSCGLPARLRPPSLRFGTWTRRHGTSALCSHRGQVCGGWNSKTLPLQRLIGAERPDKLLPRTLYYEKDWSWVGGGANLLRSDLQRQSKHFTGLKCRRISRLKWAWPDAAPLCLRRWHCGRPLGRRPAARWQLCLCRQKAPSMRD